MPDRRTITRAAALAVVVPSLAGCGGTEEAAESPFSSPSPSSSKTPRSPRSKRGPEPLIPVSQVPVEGAVFINAVDVPGPEVANGVVVTQPKKGEFHAFSRDCSHQHCAVSDVRDGDIHCFCHDSLYDLTTGEVVGGPAPSALTKVRIKVKGDAIYRA